MITFSAGAGVPYLWWDSTAGSGEGTHGSVNASKVNIYFETSDFASGYSWPLVYTYEDLGGTVHTMYSYGGSPALVLPANSDGIIAGTKSAVTYTLSYNGNGSTGGSTAPQAGSNQYTVRSCGFTRTGHTFLYWATNNGTIYRPGDTITLYANTTLKAQWKANTYTISYNANGGSGAPANQTKTYGVTLTLSSSTPTWSGHTFWGWATTSARDAQVAYNAGGSYTENVSRTLYAVWVVTATFYSKGSVYSTEIKRINESITFPSPANTATQGCRGWLHNGETYSCGATLPISSDVSFTAIWKNIYTVSYNANGGSNAPSSQIKWEDEDLTLTSSVPTWSGHTFLGWSTSSARDATINYPAGSTYSDDAAVTLYAVWLCSASFYSKGTLVQTRTGRINETIILPTLQNTETEVFNGWLYNDETYSGGAELKLTANVSFVAIWVAGYKLTYRADDADSGSTPSPPLAITYTISQCGFIKNGYYFQYWRTASGTRYYPGDSLTPTRAMTLYAQWKARIHFYWHGSDETDNARFAVGQKIENALTATAWNNLYDFINEVRTDARLSTIAFTPVSAGDPISAVKFNIVSNAIHQIVNAGYGTVVPATVSAGDEIVTSLFNGRGSLKDAINKAVDDL